VGVAIWLLDPWARTTKIPSLHDYRFLGLRQRIWSALANSMSFSVGWRGGWWPARLIVCSQPSSAAGLDAQRPGALQQFRLAPQAVTR
jgi:hypothetical protein